MNILKKNELIIVSGGMTIESINGNFLIFKKNDESALFFENVVGHASSSFFLSGNGKRLSYVYPGNTGHTTEPQIEIGSITLHREYTQDGILMNIYV